MNQECTADLIIEALEVFINHILYLREVYPPQIFRKRKIYNCPVYVSIYPTVSGYITEVLNTARILKKNKQLRKLEVVLYRDESCVFEKYDFDISDDCLSATANCADEYLLDFENSLRTSLYTISERLKPLRKLPKDAKFKVLLHTSQTEFVKTCCGPANKDFPWLQVLDHGGKKTDQIAMLPLCVVNSTGLKINAEI